MIGQFSWDWAFAFSIMPDLFSGLKLTVIATLFGSMIAVVFGLVLCIVRVARLPVLSMIADLFIHPHGLGGIEESFGFPAWYGFLACVVLVGVSRLIGFILKRPDTYYDG